MNAHQWNTPRFPPLPPLALALAQTGLFFFGGGGGGGGGGTSSMKDPFRVRREVQPVHIFKRLPQRTCTHTE